MINWLQDIDDLCSHSSVEDIDTRTITFAKNNSLEKHASYTKYEIEERDFGRLISFKIPKEISENYDIFEDYDAFRRSYKSSNKQIYIFGFQESITFEELSTHAAFCERVKEELMSLCDYRSPTGLVATFFSHQYGILHISFPKMIPIYFETSSSHTRNILTKTKENLDLKNIVINQLFQFTNSDRRFEDICKEIKTIEEDSLRQYEIYIKKFDFNKLTKNAYKEFDSIIISINKTIDDVTKQSFSIPLSLAASIYSIYKIDEFEAKISILIGFILFSYILLRRTLFYERVLSDENEDFKYNMKLISSESGLPNELIGKHEGKINKKYRFSFGIIEDVIFSIYYSCIAIIIFFQFNTLPKGDSNNHIFLTAFAIGLLTMLVNYKRYLK